MSFRIAHFSDLHLGPLPPVMPWQLLSKRFLGFQSWHFRRRRIHRVEVLESFLETLGTLQPNWIVITGDLTNLGLPLEFERSLTWLRKFEDIAPVSVIPGNHDAYVEGVIEKSWHQWKDYTHGGDGKCGFPYLRDIETPETGIVRLVGLSSGVPTKSGYATGSIGGPQLEELGRMLTSAEARAAAAWTILLLHHPPFKGASKPRKSLLDTEALATVLEGHAVDMILSGHEHKHQFGSLMAGTHEIQVITVPSASLLHEDPERTGGFNLLILEPPVDHDCKLARLKQWRYDAARMIPVKTRCGRLLRQQDHWRFED